MSEQTKTLVPKLRFPEFSEEWRLNKIGDFIESYKGGAALTPSDFVSASECEVIPKKAISAGGWLKVDNEKSTYCNEEFYKNNLQSVVDNTYLITTLRDLVPSGPSIGYIVKYADNKKYILAQGVYGLKPKITIISDFLIQFSNTGIYRKMMQSVMVGSTQVHIRNSTYLSLSISIPSLNEQQKIADCLSSIDELITAQTQKITALKDHKKGLMQQLFPAEGETVPKLRFPEFENDGEWELTTIGNIGSFYYGRSAPKWSLEENALTSCVRYGELYTKFGAEITKTYSRTNIDPSSLRFSKGGEILVPRVGEKPEDFGKCCCYLPLENIAIGEMISVFETTQKPLFYTYYFRHMYKQFAKVVEGQNVKNLYYTELEPLHICRPSLPEQQKIADCLSSIDELITAQTQKLTVLKTHKKGLMQQLFPSTDEVNG